MNIGFIIDLNNIVDQEAIGIPHLSGLHFRHLDSGGLTPVEIRKFRDEVILRPEYAGQEIQKNLFFFVVKNEKQSLTALSKCLDDIQTDKKHFDQASYEMHVVCNLVDEEGVSIAEYEKLMPCLKNNAVCVYSWLLDKYDYSGGKPIVPNRRSHAIARLVWMVCNHRGELSLQQMHVDHSPIYNLFGDSSVFFNDRERDDAVRNFYYFKNIQHLLNLSDVKLEEYIKENVLPFKNDPNELEKRIDSSSPVFLKEQRVPIEATLITEKTQGLLIKSSEDDKEYLVNASDNKLVFIDDLSRKQRWQMDDTDPFLSSYRKRVETDDAHQETISDDFLKDLEDKVIVHNRTRFDEVNNEVSKSRRVHVEDFKKSVDNHLLKFLNKRERENYTELSELLTPQDVSRHCSNIDCGIAFLEYLEAGKGDYLIDKEMSAGDTNFKVVKESLEIEEKRRLQEFQQKEKEIYDKYTAHEEDKPTQIKARFNTFDREIKMRKEEIRQCNYQLEHWYDSDAVKKLTARSKSVIAFVSGLLLSGIWMFLYIKYLRPVLAKVFENAGEMFENAVKKADRFEWTVFFLLIVIGLVIGLIILMKVIRRRREAEDALHRAKEGKGKLMHDCVEEMKVLVEKHYRHMLAFHGLKTIMELLEFVKWKVDDLVSFRKTLFRLMLQYRMSIPETAHVSQNDFNTIELNDIDVNRLLFGTEEQRNSVPFCFARGGMTLAETFENFKKKKVKLETTRFNPSIKPQEEFDPVAIEKEIIPARSEDSGSSIQYTPLQATSVLPATEGIEIDDVHQGQCGDCYFLATLASIAKMNPEYIVGKNGMVEELGEDHRFFRVKFYDKDGNRVNVDVDNKFWNKNNNPIYAKAGLSKNSEEGSYDPWVMAVEKAWAKANNAGYDGIEGASGDGQERVRKVEYSFAVTGKSAFYCMTKNVPNRKKLLEMMKKHVLTDKLPITLYSASPHDTSFTNKDTYLVENHAYALRSINDDDTFNIFNPWNSHEADDDVRGKHYESVNIDFIKDNFDVVVFFGIKESDFASFERDLTDNATENGVTREIERVMSQRFEALNLVVHNMDELMTDEVMESAFVNASYLFNRTRVKDERGINKDEQHLVYMEGARGCEAANRKMLDFLSTRGQINIQTINLRDDDHKNLTILRLSPHFVLANFNE